MVKTTYNPKSAKSILKYGKALLGHSLKDIHPEATNFNGKGGLGNAVEKYHYGYEPNSKAEPDFQEVGLELKCTPLKILKDKSMASKERLVLNIINYIEEAQKDFETSSFWHKNKFLLLMFYLHKAGLDPVEMVFKLIRTWKFPKTDLKIIKDDWNKIHRKILQGKAHTLTEGDTLYLAACMKGSKANAELRKQPYSPVLAQQRAYSLKTGYMNKIILESFLDEGVRQQLHITPKRVEKLRKEFASSKIIKTLHSYKPKETFEQLVERRIQKYYGKTVEQIEKRTAVRLNIKSKALSYDVCRAIFNIKTKRIDEFEQAGIKLKSVVLEANRNKVVESMSFPYFRYVDIVNQEWEDSDWYHQLTSKFLFTIFRKSPDGDKSKMRLVKVIFWNIPYDDLIKAKELWEDTKQKVCKGEYDKFITSKANNICHVRPHGTKAQRVPTPQNTKERPMCFWLNNDYILNIILNKK